MTQDGSSKNDEYTPAIDWKDVHRRVEAARISLEQGTVPSSDAKMNILKARAKALAWEPSSSDAAGETIEIIEFMLAHEIYVIELRFVREVYPLKELTVLPGTPPFVLGLVNVRGKIHSVVDIKKFYDLPAKGMTDLNKIIILESDDLAQSKAERMVFGILADAILGVRKSSLNELQPILPTLAGIREKYFKGITCEGAVILDVEKLLMSEDIVVRQEVEA